MSTHENTATENLDVYAKVTSQIINAIEQGVGNWRMPWHTSGRFASSPINATSRKAYRGINTVCLWAAAESKGYESGEWATYAQWQERKAQVRKGRKLPPWCSGSLQTARLRIRTAITNTPQRVRGCYSRAVMLCSMRPRWTDIPRTLSLHVTDARTDRTRGNVVPVHRCRCPQRRKPRVLFAGHGPYPDAAVCRVRRKRPALFDAGA